MNHFEQVPEIIPVTDDLDLYKEILNYHSDIFLKIDLPKEIDGFYFVDNNGYSIMIDKNLDISIGYKLEKAVVELNSKIYKTGNFFVKKKILIKNNKKYYFLYSKTSSKILKFIDKNFYKFNNF